MAVYNAGGLHVPATNNSSLEIGSFMFTAFCVTGLISSALLKPALPGRTESQIRTVEVQQLKQDRTWIVQFDSFN